MADILKITPQLVGNATATLTDAAARPVAPPAPVPASLQNLPQALLRLAPNAVIQGTVISSSPDGATQVRTPQGTITVNLQNPPPSGSQVTLTLQGAPGNGSPASLTVLPRPAPAPAQRAAPAPAAVLRGAQPVTATASSNVAANAPPAPAALPDAVRPALTAGARPVLADGARVGLRIAAAGAQPGQVPASPPGTIPAQVGTAPGGAAVLQTALGTLRLDGGTALQPGTRVAVEITSAAAPRPAAAAPPNPLGLSRDWPALKEALQAAASIGPATAHMAQGAIPRPGPGLGTGLLFLMAALRLGDVRAFLGGTGLKAIHSASAELAARVGDDFAAMARLANASTDGDWRTWLLPVQDGELLRQVRLFTRNQKRRETPDDDDSDAMRFIVELELSNLGLLQIDGFTHEGRFDLMVRSASPLPDHVRDGIRSIYTAFRGDDGGRGELGFQDGKPFPVSPIDAVEAEHFGIIV